MRIELPDNISELILAPRSATSFPNALHTLEALPELAADPKIHYCLKNRLQMHGLGYRYKVAKLLCDIGDPLGIEHLIYNSLSVHPILKEDQQKVSGWSCSYLIARSNLITDEYFELFVQDMISSQYGCHIDLFAALPDEMVVDRLTELLAHPAEHVSFVAAAALAMKGYDAGRSILIRHTGDLFYTRRAMIALSHIRDDKFIDLLNLYSEGHPESFGKHPEMALMWRSVAKQRLALIEASSSEDSSAFVDVVRLWHQFPAQETFFGSILGQLKHNYHFYIWTVAYPKWLEEKYVVPTWMTDVLYEFSTYDQRKQLAKEQERNIRQLLDDLENPFDLLKSGISPRIKHPFIHGLAYISEDLPTFLPGVSVIYEKKDYIKYSTDWILHPEKYLYGPCFKM